MNSKQTGEENTGVLKKHRMGILGIAALGITIVSLILFIIQNEDPTADVYTNPPPFYRGDEIQFYGNSSSDSDGTIEKYLWDFGDGKSSDEKNPTHPYEMVGDYRVRLTVWDDDGADGRQDMNIKITPKDESDLIISLEPFATQNSESELEDIQDLMKYGVYEDGFIQGNDLLINQWLHFNMNYNGIHNLKYDVTKISFNSNPIELSTSSCLIEKDPRILEFSGMPVSTKNESLLTMPVKIDYTIGIKPPFNEIPKLENTRNLKVVDEIIYQIKERKPVTISYIKYEIESTNLDTNEKKFLSGSSPMILPIDPKNWDAFTECVNDYSNN